MALRVVIVLAAVCALALPAGASARSKPITGKLPRGGYTVIALGYNGKAVSDHANQTLLKRVR